MPVNVRQRDSPLDRPQAGAVPGQSRFAAAVAAQREFPLVQQWQQKSFIGFGAAQLDWLRVGLPVDLVPPQCHD